MTSFTIELPDETLEQLSNYCWYEYIIITVVGNI